MEDFTKEELIEALSVWADSTAGDPVRDQCMVEAIRECPVVCGFGHTMADHFAKKFGWPETPQRMHLLAEAVFITGIVYGIDVARKVYQTRELERVYGGGAAQLPETVSGGRGFWSRLFR